DRRAEGGVEEGARAGLHRDGLARGQGHHRRIPEGSEQRHALDLRGLRFLTLMYGGAAISVGSPPPCGEGLGVGVAQLIAGGAMSPHRTTPLPTPPPQGGREQTESAA